MFIATPTPHDRAPAERDVSVQQQHAAPLEPKLFLRSCYKHLVPPGTQAMFEQHTITPLPKGDVCASNRRRGDRIRGTAFSLN